MNEVVVGTAGEIKDAQFVIKLDDLLKERGLTQKDLANLTGMRVGTISEIVNGKGISLNKIQLLSIMVALRLTSLNQLLDVHLPDSLHEEFDAESKDWIESKDMPENIKELYKTNVLKTNLGDKF